MLDAFIHSFSKSLLGPESWLQCFRVLADLPENLRSVPGTYVRMLTTACNSSCRASDTFFFQSPWASTHLHAHTHTKTNNKTIFTKAFTSSLHMTWIVSVIEGRCGGVVSSRSTSQAGFGGLNSRVLLPWILRRVTVLVFCQLDTQ